MKNRFYLAIVCISIIFLAAINAKDVSATPWPGPDDFGYTGIEIPYSFTDISGTGTFVSLSDDQVSGAIPIGFTFNFYGVDYTEVYISSNGFITFSPGMDDGCCTGGAIPNADGSDNLIAGYWEDLNYPPGNIHYQTMGAPGSQRFIVQFTNNPHYSHGPQVTFQIILHEGTNYIELQYSNAPSDGGTHTIGIENSDGTAGLLYARGDISMSNIGLLILPHMDMDLIVSTLPTVSTFSELGFVKRITTIYRVLNQGTEPSFSSKLAFYLSCDQILDAGDPYVGSVNIPALAAGQQTPTGLASFYVRPPAPVGCLQYLLGVADANNNNPENNEANNVSATVLIIRGR